MSQFRVVGIVFGAGWMLKSSGNPFDGYLPFAQSLLCVKSSDASST
jgi:hypothetical protein